MFMALRVASQVIECSWDELMKSLRSATNLDAAIAAHAHFLKAVLTGALLGPENAPVRPTVHLDLCHASREHITNAYNAGLLRQMG